ncbi:MAG: hypothetical protein WCL02_09330 [bacterium]
MSKAQVSATTGRNTVINIANRNPTAPTEFFLGTTTVSSSSTILSGQFTGDFTVEDQKGTS